MDTSRITKDGVIDAAFNAINGVQHSPLTDERIVGLAASLIASCEVTGQSLSAVLTAATNVLKAADAHQPTKLLALHDYARDQLK